MSFAKKHIRGLCVLLALTILWLAASVYNLPLQEAAEEREAPPQSRRAAAGAAGSAEKQLPAGSVELTPPGQANALQIGYYPNILCHRAGTSIDLYAYFPNAFADIPAYHYTVWEQTWPTLEAFRQDPDPPLTAVQEGTLSAVRATAPYALNNETCQAATYTFAASGYCHLYLFVTNDETAENYKFEVGMFFIHGYDETENQVTVMRDILQQYPDVWNLPEMYAYLAEDMYTFARLYGAPPEEARAYLQERYGAPAADADGTLTLPAQAAQRTRLRAVDFTNSYLLYDTGAIPFSAGMYSSIDKIHAQFSDKSDEFICAAILNHLVYCHYDYGVDSSVLQPNNPRDAVSQCAYFARDLSWMLSGLGYEATHMSYSMIPVSAHALVEVSIDGSWYVFDPTGNFIYNGRVGQAGLTQDDVYILPQVRNLECLLTQDSWAEVTHLYEVTVVERDGALFYEGTEVPLEDRRGGE